MEFKNTHFGVKLNLIISWVAFRKVVTSLSLNDHIFKMGPRILTSQNNLGFELINLDKSMCQTKVSKPNKSLLKANIIIT